MSPRDGVEGGKERIHSSSVDEALRGNQGSTQRPSKGCYNYGGDGGGDGGSDSSSSSSNSSSSSSIQHAFIIIRKVKPKI